MKKVLLSSIILFLVSSSILMIQISCSKNSTAQVTNATSQIGKIIFVKSWSVGAEIWTANYDGTSASQIPITLPTGITVDGDCCTASLSISPDGQKIFFPILDMTSGTAQNALASCNIDGSNFNLIVPTTYKIGLVTAY